MKLFKHSHKVILFFALLFTTLGCPTVDHDLFQSEQLQISELLLAEESPYIDVLGEFGKAVEYANLNPLLATKGPFTLFVPDDDAMQEYYKANGISAITELSKEEVLEMVSYHLIPATVYSTDVPLGNIETPNAGGDFIITEFDESEIVVNKNSVITDRDIIAANGVIQKLNRVIDFVTKDCFEALESDGGFKIFVEGLKKAGIEDTLHVVQIPYGKLNVRTRYTIFAVPDSVYIKNGINTIDELVSEYNSGDPDLKSPENGFYQYMIYHCIEGTYYTSGFAKSAAYPVLSRENQLNIKVDFDYQLNYDAATKEFTGLILDASNIPAKNGSIHAVNGLLPSTDKVLTAYTFQMTDFPDVKSQDSYQSFIKNFYDGDNTFEKIKWSAADYMQYYFKESESYVDHDAVSMSDGFWILEITIPKIPKGKYHLSGHFKTGNNRANVILYIDDVKVENVIEFNMSEFAFSEIDIADVNWDKTEEHVFKMKTIYPGIIFWDWTKFTPIAE